MPRNHRYFRNPSDQRKAWDASHPFSVTVEQTNTEGLTEGDQSRALYKWLNGNCGKNPTGNVEDGPFIVVDTRYGSTLCATVLFKEELPAVQFKLSFS